MNFISLVSENLALNRVISSHGTQNHELFQKHSFWSGYPYRIRRLRVLQPATKFVILRNVSQKECCYHIFMTHLSRINDSWNFTRKRIQFLQVIPNMRFYSKNTLSRILDLYQTRYHTDIFPVWI